VFSPLFWLVGVPLLLMALSLLIGAPVWLYRRVARYRLRDRDAAARRVLEALRRQDVPAPAFRLFLRPFVVYHREGGLLGGKRGRNRYGQRTASVVERLAETLFGSPEDHLEEAIAKGFHRDEMPLVALGDARNLGGGRIEVSDREWRAAALLLMRHAHQIIIIPSYRAGTLWEMEQILELDAVGRTICVMPPHYHRRDEEEWAEVARTLIPIGIDLPPYQRRDALLFFPLERRPPLPSPART
jgi:hypothetical protein